MLKNLIQVQMIVLGGSQKSLPAANSSTSCLEKCTSCMSGGLRANQSSCSIRSDLRPKIQSHDQHFRPDPGPHRVPQTSDLSHSCSVTLQFNLFFFVSVAVMCLCSHVIIIFKCFNFILLFYSITFYLMYLFVGFY